MKCDFCQEEGDWKMILRAVYIEKKDGSDVRLCNTCMNLYAQQNWDELSKRVKEHKEITLSDKIECHSGSIIPDECEYCINIKGVKEKLKELISVFMA